MQINNTSELAVIRVENLSFTYDKDVVLENVNLKVFEKDFLVLIGPNGGGKSTLMKLILGINPIKTGKIKILNESLEKGFSGLAYVPQNTNVNINFPIKTIEVVIMGNKQTFFGYSKNEIARAISTLKQVGMEKFADTKIGLLSGGQRQRVMIARAIYSNPKILFLDEPTSNIDTEGQKSIYELLKKLNKEITIVVISHDLSMILEYATKVAHINKKLSFHDLRTMKKKFKPVGEHICEVELLQMIGSYR